MGIVMSKLFLIPLLSALPLLAQDGSISAEHIREHTKFLSSDLLEGRGVGVRGGQLATEYIATQFALAGAKPAGDNGTYFQKVPLVGVETQPDAQLSASASGKSVDFRWLSDFVGVSQLQETQTRLEGEASFVGHGIAAPEWNWDDFKGIDVKGKVLVLFTNEPVSADPKFFDGRALTYYGRWTYKYEEAARRGAVGVLIIHRTDLASYPWDVVRNSQAIEKSYLQGDPSATLRAAAWIQHDVAQQLLTMAGLGDLDQAIDAAGKRGFHAVEFPVRLRAHVESHVHRYDSTNVMGRVAGVSSAGQAVLYSAHYDHLGIDPNAKGDNVYNGAADNGTGCGILLEMARAFAQSPTRPPHAMYFASVTAEEQGLLGSQYLGMHPPVPASQITLDLNYDMILPIGVPLSANL